MDDIVPVVGVAESVLFPGMTCTLLLGTVRALGAVREATRCMGPAHVAICAATPSLVQNDPPTLYPVGVRAVVIDLQVHPSGLWLAEFCAQHRVRVQQVLRDQPFRLARVNELAEQFEPEAELQNLVLAARHNLLELKTLAPQCTVAGPVLRSLAQAKTSLAQINALMGCTALLPIAERQSLLECARASERLEAIVAILETRVASHKPLRPRV